MSPKILLLPILVFIVGCTAEVSEKREPSLQSKPNIIFILADDLGYGDLGGYFGGEAKTPNIDRMAREGMLFTDFHSNGPMCSPTRAALLTGRYPQRLGIESALPTDWEDEGIGSDENRKEKTIASYLQSEGYVTSIFGKWHLGKAPNANPALHGFDEFRGLTCGSGDYFSKMDRNGFKDWWHNDQLEFQEGYATHVITDNATGYIEENKDKTFFMYVAYSAIHFPWQTAEDGDKEVVREGEDYTSIYPGPQSKLGPYQPEEVPSVVVNMVEELDQGVGHILEAIRQNKLSENTLVFFTSDNGGYINYADEVWPVVGSNGPLRGQKTQVYEGGHRVPAIAWWPGMIKPLSVSDETAMTFDLMPTVFDLLNIKEPKKNSPNALDGVSLIPLLMKGDRLPGRTLYWRMDSEKAVRDREWKLIINEDNSTELYNLHNDIGEQNNLVGQYPEKVVLMKEKLASWEKGL
ncbi:MAG: sulfatase-like hydrolase/transferase [Cyclobacteriaceae bacterium]